MIQIPPQSPQQLDLLFQSHPQCRSLSTKQSNKDKTKRHLLTVSINQVTS